MKKAYAIAFDKLSATFGDKPFTMDAVCRLMTELDFYENMSEAKIERELVKKKEQVSVETILKELNYGMANGEFYYAPYSKYIYENGNFYYCTEYWEFRFTKPFYYEKRK